MSRTIPLPDEDATQRLGFVVAHALRTGEAVCLSGPLGAGKTTLARGLVRALTRTDEDVPSPTFTLVQTYETRVGVVHHYDLWRLDGSGALDELGWDEARDDIVLVEWPDRLGDLCPDDALTIVLALEDGDARVATVSGWADRIGRIA